MLNQKNNYLAANLIATKFDIDSVQYLCINIHNTYMQPLYARLEAFSKGLILLSMSLCIRTAPTSHLVCAVGASAPRRLATIEGSKNQSLILLETDHVTDQIQFQLAIIFANYLCSVRMGVAGLVSKQ